MRHSVLLGTAILVATPAHATQGMICEAKGASVDLLYGHAAVPGLLSAQLEISGNVVPTAVAQSWAGDDDTMIDLADPDQMEVIAKIRLKWVKQEWRGTLQYKKRTYKLTCGEAG
jgi:hypothetical protein